MDGAGEMGRMSLRKGALKQRAPYWSYLSFRFLVTSQLGYQERSWIHKSRAQRREKLEHRA